MRLIDADELKIDYGFTWDDITPTHEEMYALIDRQPTIEERKKGCREHTGVTKSYRFTCSVCGQTAYYVSGSCGSTRNKISNICKYKFCPHCGARMTEGKT